MLELYEELSAISTTERDVPLKKMTTLRVGGEAAYVVYPENEMSLDAIMRIIRKNSIPFKVIGKGSNLLCGDGRYEGVIIRLDRHFTDFFFDGEYVTVQAGCSIIALAQEPAFAGTETVATNRMVYGFVNLSKAAAYLAPSVTADDDKKLAGVVFDIYSGTGASKTLYVSGIVTDENGNLTRSEDGTYGKERKFLISGTYTLMERSTKPGYSVWSDGVAFTVGVNGGTTDTGEHGTAWISTRGSGKTTVIRALLGCLPVGGQMTGGMARQRYQQDS